MLIVADAASARAASPPVAPAFTARAGLEKGAALGCSTRRGSRTCELAPAVDSRRGEQPSALNVKVMQTAARSWCKVCNTRDTSEHGVQRNLLNAHGKR